MTLFAANRHDLHLQDEPVMAPVGGRVQDRCRITAFRAEHALTRDAVPLRVDAIIFWCVADLDKAAPAFAGGRPSVTRIARAALCRMIGASTLATMLCKGATVDRRLLDDIRLMTARSGLLVRRVQIRSVGISPAAQAECDARSLKALSLCRASSFVFCQPGEV